MPLRGERGWREADLEPSPNLGARLSVLCSAYGEYEPDEVLDAVNARQQLERERTMVLGGAGVSPWTAFLARGDVEQIDREHEWLTANRQTLLDAASANDGMRPEER